MVRRTCTAIAVLAQGTRNYHRWASHGVALLSDHAHYALDRRNRPYVMVRSCFVGPETGRKRHLSSNQKAKQDGGRENRTRVEPSTLVFCPTPIAPKTQNPRPHPRRPGTGPTSAPTSAARPLIHYSEFLERSRVEGPVTNLRPPVFFGGPAITSQCRI